jgi:deoxyribose-phosphate aldolase
MSIENRLAEILKNRPAIAIDKMNPTITNVKEWSAQKENQENEVILKQLFNLIDLTTLEGKDTDEKVQFLGQKALDSTHLFPNLPTVAALCVYPSLVAIAKKTVQDSPIRVTSVATGFPSGQIPLFLKVEEVKYALDQGADEIDMVISRGKLLSGHYSEVYDEIVAVKAVCGAKTLKVILETGELDTLENIRLASDIAIAAGADFIKTSTGKIPQGASLEAIYTMLQAIKSHFSKTGKIIGIKPSGGISSVEVALQYYKLVEIELGESWLNNNLFRFGASSLAGKVLQALTHDNSAGSYFNSSY